MDFDSSTAHLLSADAALLRVEHLTVEFSAGRGRKVHAVSDVSFDVAHGETLGLVGESGCGKSTTALAVLGLHTLGGGSIRFDGVDITGLSDKQLRPFRPRMQLIFQDPVSSLNPRRKVRDIIGEPLRIQGVARDEVKQRVNEVLGAVGMDPDVVGDRRPGQFSGGQCQRISIARALVINPELIICDESVSALDVSIQAQILNLLKDLKARYALTLVFIAHDLAVVRNISDRVAVMYLGKMCEMASSDAIYAQPAHPYTAALLAAIPVPDPFAPPSPDTRLPGELPSPITPPSGCRFRTRCPRAEARCADEEPLLRPVGERHFVACHFPLFDINSGTSGVGTAASVDLPATTESENHRVPTL